MGILKKNQIQNKMKFVAVAVLALVMLQANALRALTIKDDAACQAAVQNLVPDVMTLVHDVQAKDALNAMVVLTTKVVPELQTINAGGQSCYLQAALAVAEEVAGEFVGQQC